MKTLEQLSNESLRTAPSPGDTYKIQERISSNDIELLHSAMGLASESGELMGAIKAHIIYGRTLDIENIEEELGDIWWYFNLMCSALGTTPERIISMNIEKLRIRYPEKYSDADANERKDKVIVDHPIHLE